MSPRIQVPIVLILLCVPSVDASAGQLLVGAATASLTPDRPVALDGQMDLRVSHKPDTPVMANVLALESREGDRTLDTAIFVSCDAVALSKLFVDRARDRVRKRLPDLDPGKVFLNATHTHTAPVNRLHAYQIPEGVMQVEEYCDFAADRIADAIEKAWKNRTPGSFTWGLGHAAVAENRRALYADGHAEMYGNTNRPDFRGLEGYEDHDVGTMFFWDGAGTLVAIVVNVACPAQEVEHLSNVNGDFWHPVRQSLRKRYGQNIGVLAWVAAAGDLSPHLMVRKDAEQRMLGLRKLSRLDELARRIVAAVDDTFEAVKNDRHSDVPLVHKVETVRLPMRLVTDAEYAAAKASLERDKPSQYQKRWLTRIVERYEGQKKDPHPLDVTEVHAIRIGDAAVCTNNYELFTDFGVQIKARSPAVQTFVVQLGGGDSSFYLPTERAVHAGGYSAIVQCNLAGPEGGIMLVNRTLDLLDSIWSKPDPQQK